MPYAINDTLSKKPIDGGIEITDAEYKAAMDAKLQGRDAYVHNGGLLIESELQRTVYSTTDGSEKQIADNAPLPDGYTETARPSDNYDWDGVQWVVDISKAAGAKVTELKAACRAAIFSGFTDDALAVGMLYPAKQDGEHFDQTNLIAQHSSALNNSSATYKIMCRDSGGAWARREHTAAQTIQVGEAGLRFVEGKKNTLDTKIGQVRTIEADDTLTDEEKRTRINAITW